MKTTTLFAIVTSFLIAPTGQLLSVHEHTAKYVGATACAIFSGHNPGKQIHPVARLIRELVAMDTVFTKHTGTKETQATATGNTGNAILQKQQVAPGTFIVTSPAINDAAKTMRLQQPAPVIHILFNNTKDQQQQIQKQQQTIWQQQNRISLLENELKQLKLEVSKLVGNGSQ